MMKREKTSGIQGSQPAFNGSIIMLNQLLNKEALHHAYILYGDHGAVFAQLSVFLESDCEVRIKGNPDFFNYKESVLTIDVVRSIIENASKKSVAGKKIFVLQSDSLTREAQNALLKILEEPNEGTHFFINLSKRGSLLPTVQSRVIEIDISQSADETHVDVTDFVNGSLEDRMKMVEVIAKDKDRSRALRLIHGLLEQRQRLMLNHAAIRSLELGSRYINMPSSSVKTILENIALKFTQL